MNHIAIAIWVVFFCLGAQSAQAAQPLGHLDAATPTYVGGWAFDPDHPTVEIAIHVYVNGTFATAGTTTGFRPDVNAAYGITGNHGYTLPLDFSAYGPGTYSVVAYGIDLDGEGNPGLIGSPQIVTISCAPQCTGKQCGPDGCGGSCGSCGGGQTCTNGTCVAAGDQPAIGSLDVVAPGQIGGWAKDPDYNGPIAIHIYIDGVLFKALLAQDYRPGDPLPYSPAGNEGTQSL